MAAAAALYSPQVLALATGLAAFPPDTALPLKGQARSPACGSTLTMHLSIDAAGRIDRIGLRAHACAIGQASAAIFASAAPGQTAKDIATALSGIERWLKGEGELPDWPGLEAVAAARAYPARHGAMLLPWKAAVAALSSTQS
ncbi:NifU-like protein [Novosphingobium kunmingense]|uniref:NifU-like protein n=1 Tax=Novosphingobium kunmingense TaxID=1211806 RepID=A0A2N0I2M4_9SPHN|nr:iron-sulfur cluster assembly scaffold protein [Novosphingobium kunmingense]PKB25458.1 NifU-like protein [Novosphingobium kunmingense]